MSGTRDRRQRRDVEVQERTAARTPAPAVDRRSLDPDRLAALEEERDFLLRSLRDLAAERAAGDIEEVDYVALEEGYTRRAAEVLKAIEQRRAGLAAVRTARHRPGRRVAVVAGVVAFAVVAGMAMAAASGRRTASDSATGDIRQSCRQGLLEAQGLLGSSAIDAIKQYDEVLELCPSNAEALTYKGWLLYQAGSSAEEPTDAERLTALALQSLGDAVVADPGYADARVFRASVFKNLGRYEDARAEIDLVDPTRIPDFMQARVDGLREEIEAATSGSTPGSTPGSTAVTAG